jgi:dUTPase
MAVEYTLELFPTTLENEAIYTRLFLGGTHIVPDGENAGVDLYCVKEQKVLHGGIATLLDLGVKARMIKHWSSYEYGSNVKHESPCHFWLAPRSSIWKSGVRQANSLGVIDKSYRGVLMGAVLTNTAYDVTVPLNTRLFQVLAPDMGNITRVILKPLHELDSSTRGEGGFGSTGL